MMSKKFLSFSADFIATTCYLGRSPYAPGTVTSAAVYLLIFLLGRSCPTPFPYLVGALFGISTLIGLWATHHVLQSSKSRDPSYITIDETAGALIAAMVMQPALAFGQDMIVSFVIFRILDITKPWPIGAIERSLKVRMPTLGVMLDDCLAGGLAAGCILALRSLTS